MSDREEEMGHDVKLQNLLHRDPSLRRLAIRHLTAADFDDEAVLSALLESLLRDDETTALAFALAVAWNVDPVARPDVVALLADALEQQARSSRAAYVMSALHQLYENHPAASPDEGLLRRVGSAVAASGDSAAFAGATELIQIALHRGAGHVAEEWLRGDDLRLIVLATAPVAGIPVDELRGAMQQALESLRGAGGSVLPPQVVSWTVSRLEQRLADATP